MLAALPAVLATALLALLLVLALREPSGLAATPPSSFKSSCLRRSRSASFSSLFSGVKLAWICRANKQGLRLGGENADKHLADTTAMQRHGMRAVLSPVRACLWPERCLQK